MVMKNDIDYGNLTKKIVFVENDHRQAQLIIKLQHAGMTQSAFFRHLITGFLSGDPRLISYIDDVSDYSKVRKAKTKRLREEGQTTLKESGLSEQQLVDIFDIIAEEHPDL
tara:strand:+ start:151 stop:483 length:333 start_codon:yes stop_codon:yes gene_type:complete